MKHKAPFRDTLVAASLATFASLGFAVPACADEPQPHSEGGAVIGDTVITGKVKAKFLDDVRLKKAHISVTTTNGVVTLTGAAPNSEAVSAAKELASTVEGVKSVDNQVATPSAVDKAASSTDRAAKKTGKYASDSWITTKVKSALGADSITNGFDISVKTGNGVVALEGSVANQDAADHAKDVAMKIKGVKSVDTSRLKVAGG